jgi:transcriptional regulator with XRE-family HTH domain
MSLRDRVHELRKELGWSQADLTAKIGADAGQISRYENGRITPSADAIGRLAEVFDVSTDNLLIEDAPRRPLRGPEDALGPKPAELAHLDDNERALVLASSTPSPPKPSSAPSPAPPADARSYWPACSQYLSPNAFR